MIQHRKHPNQNNRYQQDTASSTILWATEPLSVLIKTKPTKCLGGDLNGTQIHRATRKIWPAETGDLGSLPDKSVCDYSDCLQNRYGYRVNIFPINVTNIRANAANSKVYARNHDTAYYPVNFNKLIFLYETNKMHILTYTSTIL